MATLNELFETYINDNYDGVMSQAAIVKAYELLLGLTGNFADKAARVQFWVDKELAVSEFLDEFLATAARLSEENAAAWGETTTERTAVVNAAQNAVSTSLSLEEVGTVVANTRASYDSQEFTLTAGVDQGKNFTGGVADDTFTADYDVSASSATLTALDVIDGGEGADTLAITHQNNSDYTMAGATISNVENITIAATQDITADASVSSITGLQNLTVTKAIDASLTAGSSTAVNVSGVTGVTSTSGGSSVTVAQSTSAGVDATAGDVTSVTVDAAKDANVTISSSEQLVSAGGNNDLGIAVTNATGDVTVSATGVATDGSAATLDAITVSGGTSVSVTQSASSDMSEAEEDATAVSHTLGDVTVTSQGDLTDVTITQDQEVATTNYVGAVEGVSEARTVTFLAMKTGETVTIDGLTFEASKDLTAAEAAAAFAGLAQGGDTQDAGGPTANGFYTGALDGDWVSGEANGSTVVFSQAVAGTGTWNAPSDTIAAGNVSATQTATAVTAKAAVTGVLGVVNGTVIVNDHTTASIKNITVDGYGTNATLGGGQSLDALETLTLKNSDTGTAAVTTTQTALTLNVDDVDAAVTVSNTITDLTLNVDGESSFALNSTGVKNATITANEDLTLSGTALAGGSTSVETVTIAGDSKVTLGDISTNTALNSFTASANTGGVSATIEADAGTLTGDITEYVLSGGDDTVTVVVGSGTAADVKVSGGAGDDTISLTSLTTAGGLISGGTGTDTLAMSAADAATASGSASFEAGIDAFEKLSLGEAAANRTVNADNMDDVNYVITTGTGASAVFAGAVANLGGGTETITFTFNGVSYTSAAIAVGAADSDVNTAIDAATDADGNALGANKITATFTNSGADITLAVDTAATDSLTGGVYDDTADINATNIELTISELANNSTIEVSDAGNTTVATLADATGTSDSINLVMNKDTTVNAGTVTVNDIETVNITATDIFTDANADGIDDNNAIHTLTLDADDLTTVVVTGDDLVLDTNSTKVTSVDASALAGGLTYTADGATAGTTVTGGAGADTLIGSGSSDVLVGGAGNDALTGATLTQLTGGEGNDTFYIGVAENVNSASAILDLSSGDVIELIDNDGDMAVFAQAALVLDTDGNPDLQNYADAAIASITADNSAAWFQYNGNTYIVMEDNNSSNADTFVNGEDVIVKITGLVDLSTASFNGDDGTLEIA